MSEIAKLETDAVNFAKDVKAGIEDAGDDAVKLAVWLGNNSTKITALADLAGAGAAKASTVGLNLTNLAINAVKAAGGAAATNGLTVSLDQSAISAVQDLIETIEKV
jgi:hypothetical protein